MYQLKKMWPYNNIFIFFFIMIMILFNFMSLMTNNLNHLWMLLEINSLIFFYLIIQSSNKSSSMIPILFISQSISSLIMIWTFNINNKNFDMYMINFWLYLSIFMKIGLFPFTWLTPIFFKDMTWMMIFIFSTLQKFIPMIMINLIFIKQNNMWIFIICLISLILSTIKSLFTNNFKSIMALSSINNSCWMISIMLTDFKSFMLFFFFYSIIMFLLTNFLTKFNINNSIDFLILNLLFYKFNYLLFFIMILFSLSMIPPFCSFIIKMNTTIFLTLNNLLMFNLTLMICSTLSIIMYFNILIKSLYFISIKSKLMFKLSKFKFNFILLISLMLFSLTFLLSIYLIF